MSEYAAREEDALEEEARHRTQEIATSEDAAVLAAEEDAGPSPDAEIAQVRRSGRQHDHSDTAAYTPPSVPRVRGPRR